MITLLTIIFILVCVLLITVVLLQKGRGGGLGIIGGGGSQSAFGTRTGDVFTWVTIALVVVFLTLAIGASKLCRPAPGRVSDPIFIPPPRPISSPHRHTQPKKGVFSLTHRPKNTVGTPEKGRRREKRAAPARFEGYREGRFHPPLEATSPYSPPPDGGFPGGRVGRPLWASSQASRSRSSQSLRRPRRIGGGSWPRRRR